MYLKSKLLDVRDSLFYFSDSKCKTIFANICNLLMLFSLVVTFCFYDIYPYNLVNKLFYFVISAIMLLYVVMFSKIKIGSFAFLIIAFFFFIFLSFLLNKNSSFQTTLISLFITGFCFYQFYASDKKLVKIAINLLLIACVIFTIYFFVIYFDELIAFDLSLRLGSKISNENDVAMLMLFAGTLFFYFIFRKMFWLIPFALLNIIEMLSTGSRSGLIFLFLIQLAAIYMTVGYKKKTMFFIIVFVIVGATLVIMQFPFMLPLKKRFDEMFLGIFFASENTVIDASTNERIGAAYEGLLMMLYNPFFGVGNNMATQYTNQAMVIHNAYLEVGLAYGVIALAIYLSLSLIPMCKLAHKNNNCCDSNKILFLLVLGIFVFLFTLSAYRFKPHFIVMALAFALIDNRLIEIDAQKMFLGVLQKLKIKLHKEMTNG